MTTTSSSLQTADADPPGRLYARFLLRFRALVADACIYAGGLLVPVLVLSIIELGRAATTTVGIAWIGFVLCYEAVLVSWRGATVGHRLANCRVIELRTGDPPSFLRAWARFWLKAVAGLLAFIFMPLTRRHQALHDLALGTAVVIADEARAKPWYYAHERSAESLRVPVRARRRVAIIIVYSILGFLAFSGAIGVLLSPACVEFNQCTPTDRLRETALGYGWLGTQALWIFLGWRGLLPGARPQATSSAGRDTSTPGAAAA